MSYWEEEYFEPGIFDAIFAGALDRCKTNLKKEVKAYIEKNSDELKKAKERIAKQEQKISELKETALGVDKIREQVKSELLRAMWEDVRPGDLVWLIRARRQYRRCERCKGKRKIKVELHDGVTAEATCPDCEYEGVPDGVKYEVYSQKLDQITITLQEYKDKLEKNIKIFIDGIKFGEYDEKEIALCKNWDKGEAYRTKEEAEAEIRRRENQGGKE